MKTVNPEAADRLDVRRPLPEIGEVVLYFPRIGERRRGRDRMPAFVVGRDPDNRLLSLVVIFEAQDFGDQDRVPERVGDDRGWLRMRDPAGADPAEVTALRHDLAELRAIVMGEFNAPPMSLMQAIDNLDERVDILEGSKPRAESKATPARKGAKKKATKRGRGAR